MIFLKKVSLVTLSLFIATLSFSSFAADGGEVYNTYCAVCHKSGLNAAPKMGNKALWIKRVAQGKETVYKNAIEGIRGMPPKGGIASLSDEDVNAAVDYMVGRSGGWGK
jgi:cytochrome c5